MDFQKLDTEETAGYVGLTRGHLANLRSKNMGAPYYKIGGRIFYNKVELDDYIEKCRVVPALSNLE